MGFERLTAGHGAGSGEGSQVGGGIFPLLVTTLMIRAFPCSLLLPIGISARRLFE
ncbi:MAG: hypothetical protein ACLR23_22650 [Clostridia bacterium]